ncbi:transposase [Streptomyces sp. NPDC005533]|uniref:transposase n=1 Tax=Streptomyces sp. NPDC005533 TaxID=3364723 RepID=UPI0036ABCAD4
MDKSGSSYGMTRVRLTDEEWKYVAPYLPIGRYGPYPERLRKQFEGVLWRFSTGERWREMPQEFGAWSTVHNRFRQWRDAGVFEAILRGLSPEAVPPDSVDSSRASVASTTVGVHDGADGLRLSLDAFHTLEKAAAEAERARQKAAVWKGQAAGTT